MDSCLYAKNVPGTRNELRVTQPIIIQIDTGPSGVNIFEDLAIRKMAKLNSNLNVPSSFGGSW